MPIITIYGDNLDTTINYPESISLRVVETTLPRPVSVTTTVEGQIRDISKLPIGDNRAELKAIGIPIKRFEVDSQREFRPKKPKQIPPKILRK